MSTRTCLPEFRNLLTKSDLPRFDLSCAGRARRLESLLRGQCPQAERRPELARQLSQVSGQLFPSPEHERRSEREAMVENEIGALVLLDAEDFLTELHDLRQGRITPEGVQAASLEPQGV